MDLRRRGTRTAGQKEREHKLASANYKNIRNGVLCQAEIHQDSVLNAGIRCQPADSVAKTVAQRIGSAGHQRETSKRLWDFQGRFSGESSKTRQPGPPFAGFRTFSGQMGTNGPWSGSSEHIQEVDRCSRSDSLWFRNVDRECGLVLHNTGKEFIWKLQVQINFSVWGRSGLKIWNFWSILCSCGTLTPGKSFAQRRGFVLELFFLPPSERRQRVKNQAG